MSISKFYKHYKISPQELKKILIQHKISDDIRFVNHIPFEWINIVSKVTGIEAYKLTNITDSEKKDSQPNKLQNIKLKTLEELSVLQNTTNSNISKHIGYVKYVSPDKSHAFIKIISDINNIHKIDLRKNDSNDYKIFNDCDNIESNQLIKISFKEGKYKKGIIEDTYFSGIVNFGKYKSFTEWVAFDPELSINNKLSFSDNFLNIEICSVSLKYSGGYIKITKEELKVDQNLIIDKVRTQFLSLIQKFDLTLLINPVISTFKEISIDADQILDHQFKLDFDDKSNFESLDSIKSIFKKWLILKPSKLSINEVYKEEYLSEYFKLWLQGISTNNFWEEHLIDACISIELLGEIGNEYNIISFASELKDYHIDEITQALDAYFQKQLLIEDMKIFKILNLIIDISKSNEKEKYKGKTFSSASSKLQFDFWKNGVIKIFPKEIALSEFNNQTAEIQQSIIDNINDIELELLIPYIKELLNDNLFQRLEVIIQSQIIKYINPLSFDLESDTNEIFEIAWNENKEWKFFRDKNTIPQALYDFKNSVSKDDTLIIGHNIVAFDIEILKKYDILINPKFTWDTILIETFLSPHFNSLSLLTAHSAKEDAQLTLNLFFNQLLRIIKTPQVDLKYLFEYLPEKITNQINICRENLPTKFLNIDKLKQKSELFYRPQIKLSPIIKNLLIELEESKTDTHLILGPPIVRLELCKSLNIQLFPEIQKDINFRELDINKINEISTINPWVKTVLKNFIKYAQLKGITPFWGVLSSFVSIRLKEELSDIFDLCKDSVEVDLNSKKPIFITTTELLEQYNFISQIKNGDVFVLYSEFISTTQKKSLKDMDLEMLSSMATNSHFWMKFSGGQSYVSLSKNDCESLNVEIPFGYTNFWIEKYEYAKYKVWGNYNWEKLIDGLILNKVYVEDRIEELKFNNVYYAKINASKSLSNETIRFNPESLYRSRYWVYQKELIDQIGTSNKPIVLFVNQSNEVQLLEIYFKKLGYFVPDSSKINISRRLEFLHQNKMDKKIIIDVITNFYKVIQANYLGSLNIIFDGFNLVSNYYSAKESSYFQKQTSAESIAGRTIDKQIDKPIETSDEEEGSCTKISQHQIKDVFFLLKLLEPQIAFYRSYIQNDNPNHTLWLLDARIADYPNLGHLWNLKSKSMNVWKDKHTYENDVKIADQCIPGVKPIKDLPFSIEEIKNILSKVFLKNGDTWYDYQVPYLDAIIPGKTDLLVTLPTGGGKSLLFQAPALFKSAFTNRLSLVVTPLKALMEDQVSKLWEEGFYGCVEYLNSDRSTDTQVIYRALAGGEISLLFITPERFRSRSFKNALEIRMQSDGGLDYIIFDEAHCVSQWGHEFRPDYFNCAKEVHRLKTTAQENIPLLLFSATVSEKIYQDLNQIFDD